MTMQRRSVVAAMMALYLGRAAATDARPVNVSTDDGLLVLDLPLESARRLPDGSVRLIVRGQLNGEPLGFGLDLHAEPGPAAVDDAHAIRLSGYGALRSVGAGSNRFVALLASSFDLPMPMPMPQMQPLVPVVIAGIDNDLAELMSKPVRAKVFLHSGLIRLDHDRDAEVFLKIDVAAGVVQFREKDVGYRRPLLLVLTTS